MRMVEKAVDSQRSVIAQRQAFRCAHSATLVMRGSWPNACLSGPAHPPRSSQRLATPGMLAARAAFLEQFEESTPANPIAKAAGTTAGVRRGQTMTARIFGHSSACSSTTSGLRAIQPRSSGHASWVAAANFSNRSACRCLPTRRRASSRVGTTTAAGMRLRPSWRWSISGPPDFVAESTVRFARVLERPDPTPHLLELPGHRAAVRTTEPKWEWELRAAFDLGDQESTAIPQPTHLCFKLVRRRPVHRRSRAARGPLRAVLLDRQVAEHRFATVFVVYDPSLSGSSTVTTRLMPQGPSSRGNAGSCEELIVQASMGNSPKSPQRAAWAHPSADCRPVHAVCGPTVAVDRI